MEGNHISFRFIRDLDADILEAVAGMQRKEVADLAKNGLRVMLGIRTVRTIEVREWPLEIPPQRKLPKPLLMTAKRDV